MADDRFLRFRHAYARSVDGWIDSTPLTILVLGPNMEERPLKPSGRLRREIYRRCPEYGVAVKGELRDLITDAKARMGAGFDLCLHEMRVAKKSDVIIIIPDSSGSFAELGLFALEPQMCAKSLVLFNRSYKKINTFLRQGPARAYDIRKATVLRVNYDDVDEVWKLVVKELQRHRAAKMGKRRRR